MLDVVDASVRFGDKLVLDRLSGRLHAGELTVVIGANAAGKTTLMRCILGKQPLCSGAIRKSLPDSAVVASSYAIGVHRLPDALTGLQVLDLASEALGGASVQTSLEYARRVSAFEYFDRPIATCSMGTRQKLCVAMSLVGDPAMVVLDEALGGLDLLSESRSLEFLGAYARSHDACVLLVTHNLDISQRFASQVWLLHDGKLFRTWNAEDLGRISAEGRSLSQDVLDLLRRM